jgi:tRNA dimethylallyltransferase
MVMDMIKERLSSHSPSPATHPPFPSLQAIGYKEVLMYFQGEITLDETVSLIKRATKRYAKRQFTWFKKEEGIHWVDITGISESDEAFIRVWGVLKNLP